MRPREKGRRNLLEFIVALKRKGNRIILMLDGNENMRMGKLAKKLREEPINMRDAI